MIFSDLALARRLEKAEAFACSQFAEARRRRFPESGSKWIVCAGTTVVFDGIESPTTQTFGLGLFEELRATELDEIENFFFERGTSTMHEVCPMVGAATLDLLCARNYRPFEISNVLYRVVEKPAANGAKGIRVRIVEPEEAQLWSTVNARGWTHEHPELASFVEEAGVLCVAREQSPCFLGEFEGRAGAAAMLSLHEGVALFGGSATVPELRGRGLHGALLNERMEYAFKAGCDLAMMVAEAGSNSQRNAERKGFRVAYTRLKWRLPHPEAA
ncbi:MAG TPA: GNAT family N-acetyltransferase [Terracidiphilus sp.]|nr:GNAT family N-acetyltransferase [Terracidiphilus sp.]